MELKQSKLLAWKCLKAYNQDLCKINKPEKQTA